LSSVNNYPTDISCISIHLPHLLVLHTSRVGTNLPDAALA
jgi:hypothetical protein